jgi:hypothetical protein
MSFANIIAELQGDSKAALSNHVDDLCKEALKAVLEVKSRKVKLPSKIEVALPTPRRVSRDALESVGFGYLAKKLGFNVEFDAEDDPVIFDAEVEMIELKTTGDGGTQLSIHFE